ncbi:hypothetical protein C8J57DRAFT_1240950 [Mycena rebaudengoi]|nr:hypothetical protein C8J57DRAFT_1240950 [Mycena rebaudengoi]
MSEPKVPMALASLVILFATIAPASDMEMVSHLKYMGPLPFQQYCKTLRTDQNLDWSYKRGFSSEFAESSLGASNFLQADSGALSDEEDTNIDQDEYNNAQDDNDDQADNDSSSDFPSRVAEDSNDEMDSSEPPTSEQAPIFAPSGYAIRYPEVPSAVPTIQAMTPVHATATCAPPGQSTDNFSNMSTPVISDLIPSAENNSGLTPMDPDPQTDEENDSGKRVRRVPRPKRSRKQAILSDDEKDCDDPDCTETGDLETITCSGPACTSKFHLCCRGLKKKPTGAWYGFCRENAGGRTSGEGRMEKIIGLPAYAEISYLGQN